MHARAEQLPPKCDWENWLILAGRGWGKTRTGAECVKDEIISGRSKSIALMARTPDECKKFMLYGESGLFAVLPPWIKYEHLANSKEGANLIQFENGARIDYFSSKEPDKLRSGQFDFAWLDELSVFYHSEECWDVLQFCMRLSENSRIIITCTPKNVKILRDLIDDKKRTIVTRGTTFDNKTNLPKKWLKSLKERYDGTRTGRQELYAELLDDVEGALWTFATLEKNRITKDDFEHKKLKLIKIGVDPNASSDKNSDECGIIVGGIDERNHGYVLEDASFVGTPNERANMIKHLYYKWDANAIVAEKNNGGDMVEMMIKTVDKNLPVRLVWASRSKYTRAEPIAGLYEQGKIHHVGYYPKLEDEQTIWTPKAGKSPNRLDALVWLFTDLLLESGMDYKALANF